MLIYYNNLILNINFIIIIYCFSWYPKLLLWYDTGSFLDTGEGSPLGPQSGFTGG